MKTIQCNQLGGAPDCKVEFTADTFDEVTKLSQQHGKEMMQQKDEKHLQAMSQMKELMSNPEDMKKWMNDAKVRFSALPYSN
jgi:hypothetical protein